jgi:hypothetical protein
VILRRPSDRASYGERHARPRAILHPAEGGLMYDVAALAIFVGCFVFVFVVIEIFDRI